MSLTWILIIASSFGVPSGVGFGYMTYNFLNSIGE
jgi:hypothetical protein